MPQSSNFSISQKPQTKKGDPIGPPVMLDFPKRWDLSSVPVSGCVRNDMRMVPVRNAIKVGRGVRDKAWDAVEVRRRMRNRIEMVSVWNVINVG